MAETAVETGKRGRKAAPPPEPPEELEQPRPRGRQTKVPENVPTFWDKVAAVAKADWGPRANIYLYRVEPVIDRRRAGSQTYITKYAEPISEDRILADHGSGRYKAMLNFRKPGAEQGDEIDSLYIDLLNLQFPPKIPPGDWVDDPNNKRWAWAKKSEEKPPAGVDTLESLRVFNEIRQDVLAEQGAKPDPTEKFIEGMKFVQASQPGTSATEQLMLAIVEKVLRAPEAKTDDGWIRAELSAARERSDRLMMLLLEQRKNPADDKGGIGIIKELVGGLKELVPEVKEFFPEGGRSRLNGWQEFTLQLAPALSPILAPFAGIFAQVIGNRMTQPQPGAQPGAVRAQPNPGATGLPEGTLMPFLQMIAMPMLGKVRLMAPPDNVSPEEAGAEFAAWVLEGFSTNPLYPQALMAIQQMGPVGMVAALRGVPAIWGDKGPQGVFPSLADLEPKLPAFFQAFLAYRPDEPESEDEPEPADPAQPQSLTFSEAGA